MTIKLSKLEMHKRRRKASRKLRQAIYYSDWPLEGQTQFREAGELINEVFESAGSHWRVKWLP